ncbi:MAG: ABC transporter substrate-binding protein [Betaproteobacteria bacterium]|nr:ABC transporter substrate-binding protein [Betaproteobacteria bacterium]
MNRNAENLQPTRIRRASAYALCALTLLCVTPAGAQAQPGAAQAAIGPDTAPDVLVKTVTLEVLDLIAKDKDLQSGDRNKLVALIDAKVLPHFNFERMTILAMGASWRNAAPAQRKLLIEEFKTLLVRTYASSLTAYSNQRFDFRRLRAKPTDTDVTVVVRVLQSGAQPVPIEYDMEKTAAGWKAWDVRVAGISLVLNYRTEFANIVRDSGIDGLIKTLTAKNSAAESAASAKKK